MGTKHTQPRRILLVDDEEPARRLLARLLSREGFQVVEAGSGSDAIHLLQAQPADVLVTDIVMPKMSGIELVRRVRKAGWKLPVIYMSGFAAETIRREGDMEEGALYFDKPVPPKNLIAALKRLA